MWGFLQNNGVITFKYSLSVCLCSFGLNCHWTCTWMSMCVCINRTMWVKCLQVQALLLHEVFHTNGISSGSVSMQSLFWVWPKSRSTDHRMLDLFIEKKRKVVFLKERQFAVVCSVSILWRAIISHTFLWPHIHTNFAQMTTQKLNSKLNRK